MAMTDITRAQAETALTDVARSYNNALAQLRQLEATALEAVKDAKQAGLSQHDIATIMGPEWAAEHNPQFPPVTNLSAPRD